MSRINLDPNHGARYYLSGPRDILNKAKFDLDRLKRAEEDSAKIEVIYAAIDCCIAVASLRDWTKEWCKANGANCPAFTEIEDFRTILELANGAKHFAVANNPLPRFTTGAIFLTHSGGKPIKMPHFLWVGFGEEVQVVRPMLERVIGQIEDMLDSLGVE